MKIWVPKFKIVEPNKPLAYRLGVAGRYKLEAIRPDGRRRLLADWFPNLITDAGLNAIGTANSWLNQCRVGTGTTTPAVTDTSLEAQVAATTTNEGTFENAQATPPYYGSRIRVYRFATGVAEGNLTEVGIGMSTSPNTLFSRELIRDSEGDPTTVTVQSDEVLDVTYELRLYPPLVDVEDQITLDGDVYDYVLRAAAVTLSGGWSYDTSGVSATWQPSGSGFAAYSGSIGAITTTPSGTTSNSTSVTNDAYSNDSLERVALVQWGLNNGNFGGGIGAVVGQLGSRSVNSGFGRIQIGFTPNIDKDNTKILTLEYTGSWDRRTL